ncbi:MAG: hypothetical protein AB1432_11680 [Bacteroidota bacterium]
MTIKKTSVNITCEQCGATITAGSYYEQKCVPAKNLFTIPAEKSAIKIIRVCLDHTYGKAKKKIESEKFVQLDFGAYNEKKL